MKIRVIVFILISFAGHIAKSQLWQSAKTFSAYANSGYQQMERVDNDKFILRSADGYTSSLTVIDTSGSVLWKKTYPGLYFSNIQIVGDSIWVGGYFYNTVQINNQTYTSNKSSGSFVAVLNSIGEIKRYKVFNSSPISIRHISIRNDKVYITGGYSENLNLGTITLQGDSIASRLFIAVLNTNLIAEKAVNTEGGSCSGFCIRVDKQNKILFLADVSTIVTMNGGYLSDPNGEYCTDGGQMLTKLDENLQILWKRVINQGIRANYYSPHMFLDSLNNCTVVFTSPGGSGALAHKGLQKYSGSTGGILWQNGFSTGNGIFGQDDQGNFYSVGNTSSNYAPSYFSVGKILANGQKAFTLLDSISLPANVILPVGENNFYTVGGCGYTNEYCTKNKSVLGHYKFAETVSINEISKSDSKFNIYPNPTSNIFTLSYTSTQTNNDLQIKVIDVLGKTVYTETVQALNGKITKEINLGSVSKGTYIIELASQDMRETKKIVIE